MGMVVHSINLKQGYVVRPYFKKKKMKPKPKQKYLVDFRFSANLLIEITMTFLRFTAQLCH